MLDNIIFVISIFTLALIVYYIIVKNYSKQNKAPIFVFLAIIIISTTLQYYGIKYDSNELEVIVVLRAFFSAIKMHGGEFKIDQFRLLATDNLLYLIAISLNHIVAVAYSIFFFFNLFRLKIINMIRHMIVKYHDAYVLVGNGKNVEYFLKTIDNNKKVIIILPLQDKEKIEFYFNLKCHPTIIVADIKEQVILQALTGEKKRYVVSLAEADDENLVVLSILSKLMKTDDENRINGYIMYSDYEKSQYIEAVKNAKGRIRLFNQYDLTARAFVDQYPLTSLIDKSLIDDKMGLLKISKVNYVFLGFGKTNQQIFKKTICNNQFIDDKIHYHIFSEDPSKDKDRFLQGLKIEQLTASEDYFDLPRGFENVHFDKKDVCCASFYEKLNEVTSESNLNVFIIALGNESRNLEVAFEITQYLQEQEITNAKIFVKSKYNELYFTDEIIKIGNLMAFGQAKSTFTYHLIINEELDEIAKQIHLAYKSDKSWDEISLFEQESSRYAAMNIKTKLNLIGYDLVKDGVGISKDKYFSKYDPTNERSWDYLKNVNEAIRYFTPSIRNHLAKQEHLRWNYSLLMSGWFMMSKSLIKKHKTQKIPTRLLHSCLTSFEGLVDLMKFLIDLGITPERADYLIKDYFTMDNLPEIIAKTSYRIVER